MISGLNEEKVSYRSRYMSFPSAMTTSVPSINKPTIHIIKVRFNNIFKNEKVLFAVISVALSVISLFVGLGLYSISKRLILEYVFGPEIERPAINNLKINNSGDGVLYKGNLVADAAPDVPNSNMNIGTNGGGNANNTLIASDSSKSKQNTGISKKSIVSIDDRVVINPFLPPVSAPKTTKVKNKNPYYLLPPTELKENSDAKILMNTMVSGIMYDSYSPSAIIQISGTDYFVKKNDIIQGFKIVGINKDSVVIKRGANVYNAKVGQILATLESTNNTGTYDINNRFGGSGGVDKYYKNTNRY